MFKRHFPSHKVTTPAIQRLAQPAATTTTATTTTATTITATLTATIATTIIVSSLKVKC